MAARGNRLGGVGRFGIACVATAVAALGPVQVALAQDAPPPPPPSQSSGTEAPTSEAPPPEPSTTPTETANAEPAPAEMTDPSPAPDAPVDPEAATAKDAESAPAAQEPAPDATATTTKTAAPAPASDPTPLVKLEPAAPASTASAPPASTASAAPAAASTPLPAAEPASGAPPETSIVLVASPPAAAPTSLPVSPAAKAETAAAAAALIVSFRPHSAIALLPEDEFTSVAPVARTRVVAAPKASRAVRQTCFRPAALVPLSLRCQQAVQVVVAGSRFVRIIIPSPSPEVRAAIDRAAVRMTARRVQARPPPDSKAAKKEEHPIAEVRPTIPFGWSSGEGASHDGFSGSSGSSWTSRVFALAAVPLRVPRPFRVARIRLPSTIAHGVIAAPPSARPG